MSLITILLGATLALASPSNQTSYNPETNRCNALVERSASQIMVDYRQGERNFDCSTIPKPKGKKVSVHSVERDFARADLSGASFRGSDLAHTNWNQAKIQGADFSYANLSNSYLRVNDGSYDSQPTIFVSTKLRCATLAGTFTHADFSDADLTCPGDPYTNIVDANFSYADFTGTRFDHDSYFPSSGDLLCVEMSDSDIRKLRSSGYRPQARSVRIGQMLCLEEDVELPDN